MLDVSHRLMLKPKRITQILITAGDVLHSWTLPVLGVKSDAVPGRVNKASLIPTRSGVYFGQCSEICGRNHSFMPISMECFNYLFTLKVII